MGEQRGALQMGQWHRCNCCSQPRSWLLSCYSRTDLGSSSRHGVTNGASELYFQSWMRWAILFEVRIAWSHSAYENRRRLITCEGEVGRVGGFGVERTLCKQARMRVVGLF